AHYLLVFHSLSCLRLPPHPRSTLFPYTTLFRSRTYKCDLDLIFSFCGLAFLSPFDLIFAYVIGCFLVSLHSTHHHLNIASLLLKTYRESCVRLSSVPYGQNEYWLRVFRG